MGRLWALAGAALVTALVALALYGEANAFDCYPNCSAWQKLLGYVLVGAGIACLLFTLAAVAATIVHWRARRGPR